MGSSATIIAVMRDGEQWNVPYGPNTKNGRKKRKIWQIARSEMQKTPKKWKIGPTFIPWGIFRPSFPHLWSGAIFYVFLFFPFSTFGPFSIVCQPRIIATLSFRVAPARITIAQWSAVPVPEKRFWPFGPPGSFPWLIGFRRFRFPVLVRFLG